MINEHLTNSLQVIPVELVEHLPDEVLLVLATDSTLDLRPRLYVHDSQLNPHAYVIRYRCRINDVVSWRSCYLGALSNEEVRVLQTIFISIRDNEARAMRNRPLSHYEKVINSAISNMKWKLDVMRMRAESLGYRMHGTRIRRSGARGIPIAKQALSQATQTKPDISMIDDFNYSYSDLCIALSQLGLAAQKMLYALAVHSTRRATDAPPHSRIVRYEGTLEKVLRYASMLRVGVNRIQNDINAHGVAIEE